ncbi:transcriptional regulator [Companilactobacillus sp. RD055328]|uniref:helix-turn-helix domain-containing protein n=1 Tax=Companilactobacillus sp. RD055328 TaxID=2916634 RepID=UPI001FC7DBB3|nr:helix-turn-helix transcriptional regulator [Companilactobacillus sp. RD055328]GKQ43314.1 transcriptional regulator [Companilactobacillus sp. RD055328]
MTLGRRLKKVRVKRGYSQGDVAEFLNISRQSISRWETDNGYPDIDNLVELSKHYEISTDELLTGEMPQQQEVEGKYKKINGLLFSQNDESWILLILSFLSLTIVPFGLASSPLIIWRNKKENQFHKLILLASIISIFYNIYAVYLWVTISLDIGSVTTIG